MGVKRGPVKSYSAGAAERHTSLGAIINDASGLLTFLELRKTCIEVWMRAPP